MIEYVFYTIKMTGIVYQCFKCESRESPSILSSDEMLVLFTDKIIGEVSDIPPIIPRNIAGIRVRIQKTATYEWRQVAITCTDGYYYAIKWLITPERTTIYHFHGTTTNKMYFNNLIPVKPLTFKYSPYVISISDNAPPEYDYPVSMIHVDLRLFCPEEKYKERRAIFDYIQPHLKIPKDVKQIILQYMFML